jgi:hypothetical protein
MAEIPYLVDSNILLRWVKPDHSDYPIIISAIDSILQKGGALCYTSQNLGEFWNACTRPPDRNGYGLSPQETDRRAKLFEEKLRLLPDSWRCTRSGGNFLLPMACLESKSTTQDWPPPCGFMASSGY